MMLAALSSLSIAAHAQGFLKDVLGDFGKEYQVSGFIDAYYQLSATRPPLDVFLPYRNFDVRHSRLQLAAAQLNVVKPTSAKNPFGFTLNLAGGKNEDIQTLGEPVDSDITRIFQQAYVTYGGPGGLTVDFGKFTTWIGAESLFMVNNDLYSLSFLFTIGQPSYHLGLRAAKPFGQTTVALYGVNGWNEVHDSNGAKSFGATVSRPFGRIAATANYYNGVEGDDGKNGAYILGVGRTRLQIADLILTGMVSPKLKLTLNADYGNANDQTAGAPNGDWYGANLTGRYNLESLTPGLSVSARAESFYDKDGARSGLDGTHFNSGVLGFEYASFHGHSVLRFEVRHDFSNHEAFEDGDGSLGRKNRTTFTVAHIFRF